MPTVFITGSSRGLGLEFAQSYAGEGWRVIATCRQPAAASDLRAIPGDVQIDELDITNTPSIKALAAKLAGKPIDILINNAGVHGYRDARASFGDIDVENWLQVFKVNAVAPLKVTEAFLPNLLAGERKKIVFISSRAGSITERGSLPHHKTGGPYAYRSSKAALNCVAKGVAFDLRAKGVAVVILHPGWVKTETGGWDAPMDPATSVQSMRKVIDEASPSDNGAFRNFDGELIPW
jgi:NAD(P)-dependent dehydrogenase (short-subunit alcohol dehydrogenase family)